MSGSGSRETNEDRQKARVDAVAFQTPDGGAFFPIVGIGTSAGGLEPCKRLLAALPHDTGMAFILVQHLDPSRDSMMVDLLSGTTALAVELASEGLRVEREHLYVIPPGTYLSIVDGALRLTQPHPRGAARLPFDALLHSMARDCGPRAVCVVLSGAGADGSLGLRAVKKRGGFVIAQDPEEAGYDGMPRGAIATGCVDLVLPVAGIPRALAGYARRIALAPRESPAPTKDAPSDRLSDIIALLGAKSALDYTAYKPGTLERRVERRMAMAGMGPGEQDRYVALLREDPGELDSLAKDLLIHVTSFFRNADVFEVLSRKIVPDLVAGFSGEGPLRIWIAGCSTGEETYSIAMIVHEQIVAARRNIRLQIFASDVDDEAIATARAGFYPKQIETDVSAERLARFFAPEDDGYRVSPSLRACVVFSVQDLLADPPFSRLDMVCCRNLLIYLGPQAQKKVIALFHFALRDGGILLLGNSETVGAPDDRFHAIEQAERIYRRVGAGRSGAALMSNGAGAPSLSRAASSLAPNPKTTLAELCRRLLVEDYAPAAVLTNRNCEGLYYSGATDDYLAVPAGDAVHDLFAMARDGVRAKLRLAIQRARRENVRVVVTGGRLTRNGVSLAFSVVAPGGFQRLLASPRDGAGGRGRRGRPAACLLSRGRQAGA
jgi:two-component system CheB/CheR fusion protein